MTARRWVVIVCLGVIAAVVLAVLTREEWVRRSGLPAGLIQANGRIEGDETEVASKTAGRIREVCVREGDFVTRGQTVARLEDTQVRARVTQAEQAQAAVAAQLRAARSALQTLQLDVPLSISTAEIGVARAEAALAKAEAHERQTARDAERYGELASRGSLGVQKSEAARLDWTTAAADVTLARATLEQARRQLAQARLGEQRIATERHRVEAIEAQLEQARAVVADTQSVLSDQEIVAPASGVVLTRTVESGEVVPAGSTLFSIVDLEQLYLKVYVPESAIGKVRLGIPARVYTDAFPGRPFTATVRNIASRAEFTPREVQSPDERVKLVYAVKLYLDANPDRCLTPGLPADAVIQYDKEAPWVSPRR